MAKISGLLYSHSANIIHADQHLDRDEGLFFMRLEWSLENFDMAAFERAFAELARGLKLRWRMQLSARRMKVAMMVSCYQHCLADLLHRQQTGELHCDIPLILSNHRDAEKLAAFHGIPFYAIPVTQENRAQAEAEQIRLIGEHACDLIVLARYMQVLSPGFVARFPQRIINVHHSFLPAFTGARPYHAAFSRGVKIIGATSHYVTDVLDEGPIIDQDVMRVSHRDQTENLIEKGRDLERMVLSRAVKWHTEGRILCYGNKTVIFD